MRPLATLASIARAGQKGRPELPVRPVPAWLLLPGLIFMVAAVGAYMQYQRYFTSGPLDLEVYRGGVQAFRDGAAVYDMGYGAITLPFTYPPAALVLLYPLGVASLETTHQILVGIGFTVTFVVAWCVTGMLNYRGTAGRIGIAAAVTGLAVWLEPIQTNAGFGQINALLMGLVVLDLALLRRTRLAGVGIGIAAAIKMVPAIFVVYLLLAGRIRAAVTAMGTFVVISVLGVLIVPHSAEFWLKGLFISGGRVTGNMGPGAPANQSLRGFFARIFEESGAQTSIPSVSAWVLSALVVLALGLVLAVRAERRGEDAAAMCLIALTALLISPVSWTHHWVWIAPFLMVIADVAIRQRGTLQTLAVAVPAVVAVLFTVWPLRINDRAPLQGHGIIWVAHRHGPLGNHIGLQIYVLTGLALLALAAVWLWRTPQEPEPVNNADETRAPVAVVPAQTPRSAEAHEVTAG